MFPAKLLSDNIAEFDLDIIPCNIIQSTSN